MVIAQEVPIKFINDTCIYNVVTTKKTAKKYLNTYSYIDLKYNFMNTQNHVTFIDSLGLEPCVTKPKEKGIISLNLKNFFFTEKNKWGMNKEMNKDTTAYINLPFYYEGKIYHKKIFCRYTFQKSKLVEYDEPIRDISDTVAKFFVNDNADTITRRYPHISFTVYYTIKNISDKTIWCTKNLVAWNDVPEIRPNSRKFNLGNFITIPPSSTYTIPVKMNMYTKYNFKRYGEIIVFSEGIYEIQHISITSKFKPKGKYRY